MKSQPLLTVLSPCSERKLSNGCEIKVYIRNNMISQTQFESI